MSDQHSTTVEAAAYLALDDTERDGPSSSELAQDKAEFERWQRETYAARTVRRGDWTYRR